ncbi:MAG: energy transducer TonB [Pseudomonadota bacterium]
MSYATADSGYDLSKKGMAAAFVVAALVHGLAAFITSWVPERERQGQAEGAGMGGVELSLGAAGRSQGGPESKQREETADELTEVVPQQRTQSAPVVPEPVQPTAEPVPEPAVDPIAEPIVESEPALEAVQNLQEEALQQVSAPPKPVASPAPIPTPIQQSTIAGNAGKSGTTEFTEKGSGDNTAGGGLVGDTESYASTLLAWFEKHKEYPRRAKTRRLQGTALLYVQINRQGEVLDYRLEESSGYKILDNETLRMIKRAQPLPPVPASVKGDTLELIAPVEFFLR